MRASNGFYSFRIGNILVVNPKQSAGIEMTIIGDKYRFKSDAYIALTGSEFEAELDNKSIPFWKRLKSIARKIIN